MTMRVTMLQTRMGESGSLLTSGSTYTVSRAFGVWLVGKSFATDVDSVLQEPSQDVERYNITEVRLAELVAASALVPDAIYVVGAAWYRATGPDAYVDISAGVSSGVESGYTSAGTGIALTATHLQYHDVWRVIGSGNVVLDASVAQDGKPRFFIPDGSNSFTLTAHTNFEPGDWVVAAGATASSAEAVGGMVSIIGLNNGEVHVVSPKSMAGLTVVEATPYVNITATGTVVSGACELAGYDCTVAAGNITVYDGTSAAGTVIVPTTALAVGRVEFAYKRALTVGCHVVLSGAATVNVLVG